MEQCAKCTPKHYKINMNAGSLGIHENVLEDAGHKAAVERFYEVQERFQTGYKACLGIDLDWSWLQEDAIQGVPEDSKDPTLKEARAEFRTQLRELKRSFATELMGYVPDPRLPGMDILVKGDSI